MGSETYQLTYFNIRGIAEPIRQIFQQAGIAFTDKRVEFGDGTWETLKPNYPWGTLPVLDVTNSNTGKTFRLAQSATIARYLAKKNSLNGSGEEQSAKCDEYVDAVRDFINEFVAWFRIKDETAKAAKMEEIKEKTIPDFFGKFNKILQDNGTGWLVGDKVTWADIFVANGLYNFTLVSGDLDKSLEKYAQVGAFTKKVFGLPAIAKWIQERPQTGF